MSAAPTTIALALISHTNNGKTTLARTLTGIDVGEVRDAAHVTLLAESHTLLSSVEGDSLQLWDTPGFGDSVRLCKRLAMSGNPIGWFLREVFDRYRDRPFWLSQQALRTAKDAADVVLYLVNSSENPKDAGYLPAEMRILAWLDKPVIVLLNQLGPPRPAAEEHAEQARWQQHLAQFGGVRAVLALDAFARCWVHERVFYSALGGVLPPVKQPGYARLLATWEAHNLQRFHDAVHLIAEQLQATARDSQPIETVSKSLLKTAMHAVGLGKSGEQQRQERAIAQLLERLHGRIAALTGQLLSLHKLDPSEAPRINATLHEHFAIRAPVDKAQAGLLGAIISGAASGLTADIMAGGLTFGAGALIGGVVGALTMAGAAWGFNTSTERNETTVRFNDEFLHSLLVSSVLRYLAVAHFGRGRGQFVEGEAPAFWQAEVEQALSAQAEGEAAAWQASRAVPPTDALEQLVLRLTSATLTRLYPETTIPARMPA